MSVVPISVVKKIATAINTTKTVLKFTPRSGSEAQCENLSYYLHQGGKVCTVHIIVSDIYRPSHF